MPKGGARPGAGAKPGVISEKLKKKLLAAVSAPSYAWRFLWGESPHRVRPNQPPVPSVATV